ncbi:TCR/Tet family MFS transporter [Polluticaenibacter yanchengensis]|uniref:TCR/Tet family MFS transporter n=1 Tax=Polluticaenibacter yanchengensis TaxID=3014562 RepID=A0ABT4ULS0_9BACT|nr:TCR/Tet family MFS transporter [Chitinophagaceae bacterium LY-5]
MLRERKNQKPAALGFIFITLLIDVLGFGIIAPVLPKLLEEITGSAVSEAASYGGWLTFAYAFTQFIFAPIVGNLSDKYGRRPVLLLSLFAFGIDYILLAVAHTLPLLFVGRIIAGITGASFTTAAAYIADISTPENRSKNFGMIGAAFGIGFIIGPVIGGLLGSIGPRVPFIVAAALCLLNALYGYFILPESLDKEKRRDFDWKKANPLGAFYFLKAQPNIGYMVWAFAFMYLGGQAVHNVWSFYGIEKFGWDEKMIGYSLGVVGLLIGLVQGGLVRVINPKLGDHKSAFLGLFLMTIGLGLCAFATESWILFTFLIPYCLGGIAGPALQAIISSNIDASNQGQLQGALTSLNSATAIIGPIIMTKTFTYFTKHDNSHLYFPGASFLLGAFCLLVSLGFIYLVMRQNGKKKAVVLKEEEI